MKEITKAGKGSSVDMSTPVSSTTMQNIHTQPIGAYSINGGNDFRPGHFVLNPPAIPKYSIYDEIHIDPNFYYKMLNPKKIFYEEDSLQNTKNQPSKTKRSNFLLKAAAFLAGVFLAYTYRSNIKNLFSALFNKIKK